MEHARHEGRHRRMWAPVALCVLVGVLALGGGCESTDIGCPTEGTPCTCLDGTQGGLVCVSGMREPKCACGGSGGGLMGGSGGLASGGDGGTGMLSLDGGVGPASGGLGDGGAAAVGDAGGGEAGAEDAGAEDGSSAGQDAGPTAAGEVPDSEHCAEVADWDPLWAQYEEEVLLLTNEVRAEGADCGVHGTYGPAEPLAMQGQLRCAARLHSMDMALNDYFSHTGLNGSQPAQRMSEAGYQGRGWGENIAQDYRSPQQVVDGWVDSDGHCANLMEPGFDEIGVGYYAEAGTGAWGGSTELWTQAFGTPGGAGGGGGGTTGGTFDPCDYVQLASCP